MVWERRATPDQRFPEIVPPTTETLVRRLGLEPLLDRHASPCRGILRRWKGPVCEPHPFRGPSYIVDRREFDARCRDRAAKAGARWIADTVRTVRREAGKWHLNGNHRSGQANFLVDASGRPGRVARQHGDKLGIGERTVAVGVTFPAAGPESSLLRVERVKQGWWYFLDYRSTTSAVFVTSPERLRIVRAEGSLMDALGSSPWADVAKEASGSWSRPRTTDATPHSRLAAGEGWLAVGDAAAAFDPISSQGLTNSLSSAWFATHALRDHLQGDTRALDTYAAAVHLTWRRTLMAQDLVYRRA